MNLSRLAGLIWFAALSAGCGPSSSTWVLGVFSGNGKEIPTGAMSLQKFEFLDDGTVVNTVALGCGTELHEYLYRWDTISGGDVEVVPVPADSEMMSYVLRRNGRCSDGGAKEYDFDLLTEDGEVFDTTLLYRTDPCFGDDGAELCDPADGLECDGFSCAITWCSEPDPC